MINLFAAALAALSLHCPSSRSLVAADGPVGPACLDAMSLAGDPRPALDVRRWRASSAPGVFGQRAEGALSTVGAAMLFAPEIGMRAGSDASLAFTPDGDTVIFTHAEGARRTLMIAHRREGFWSAPQVAPFSGTWRDIEPVMAPGGRFMVFISNRPARPGGKPLDGFFSGEIQPGAGGQLWRLDRVGDGWSAPVRLPEIINSNTAIYSPAVAADGSLYFNQPDPVTRRSHIYRAQAQGDGYDRALPLPISDGTIADFDAAVAPDESYLVFSSGRSPAKDEAILFIIYRRDGQWSQPQPLGSGLEGLEARLSPDGRILYFSAPLTSAAGAPSRIFQIGLRAPPQ